MKYLLDVNALVALALLEHEFHERTARWVRAISLEKSAELATCAITELGFVRVLVQAPQYGFNVPKARQLLLQLKSAGVLEFAFLPDDQSISHLPRWVRTAKQITDGHLAGLARSRDAILATLDRRIPGSFLIPK
jgi:predicted nucleic acid-binding protein